MREYWNDNSPRARARLVELVNSADEQVALAAAKYIVDRVEGKPAQALDVTARRAPVDMSAGFAALGDAAVNALEQALKEADALEADKTDKSPATAENGDAADSTSADDDDGSPSETGADDEMVR